MIIYEGQFVKPQFMKKLSNTEAELKKSVVIKEARTFKLTSSVI